MANGADSPLFGCTAARDAWNPFANSTDNNGNVLRQLHYVPLSGGGYVLPQLDDYNYDALNRITSVTEAQLNSSGGWTFNLFTQNFNYDRWGNRTVSCSPCQPGVTGDTFTIDTATNRITAKNGTGMTYDAAGNQTYDATGNRWFDGENRMHKATQGGTTSHYVYDADGKRVRRIIGSTETWMIYGVDGELVAEYAAAASASSPQKEYGYRSGQMLIAAETSPLKVTWMVTDHLGTPRMNIRGTGTDGGSLASVTRHDYLPFGEDLIAGIRVNGGVGQYGYEPPPDGIRQKFTSKERDSETGLDYFGARFYSSIQGRFISADLPTMDLVPANPQSMNRYAYVRNNPCKNIDPNGRCSAPAGLQKGQVGICVEAFIAAKRLPKPFGFGIWGGRGDGREPNGNDPRLTARIEAKLIANPNADGKGFSLGRPQVKAAKSEVDLPNPAGVIPTFTVSLQGSAKTNAPEPTVDQMGNTSFTLTGTAQNGFQANGLPGPSGTIDFKLDFQISPNGSVTYNQETSTTREYPTYAAYAYRVDSEGRVKVTPLFVRREKDIGALEREQTPIVNED